MATSERRLLLLGRPPCQAGTGQGGGPALVEGRRADLGQRQCGWPPAGQKCSWSWQGSAGADRLLQHG
eukprot:15476193-Alexandrium_andersonii.AAC.1